MESNASKGRSKTGRNRLTPEQREEIATRINAGEKVTPLAKEFGVSRQAIDQLYKRHCQELDGIKVYSSKRMTQAEVDMLRRVLRETLPEDYGAMFASGPIGADYWMPAQAVELAERIFRRPLFRHPVLAIAKEMFPFYEEGFGALATRYRAPSLETTRKEGMPDDPEMLALMKDVPFLKSAYQHSTGQVKSGERPVKQPAPPPHAVISRTRKKRSSDELPPMEMWEFPEGSPFAKSGLPIPNNGGRRHVGVGERTGKHKGSKGSPFTKSKKRRN